MNAPLPVHRCTDRDCPSFGHVTGKSCLCHKTETQLLVEQRDDLLKTLTALVDAWDGWYDGVPVSFDLGFALDAANERLRAFEKERA